MDALRPVDLLTAWESGLARPMAERALALLALAQPDRPPTSPVDLPVGQRDGQLLDLRERIFGPQLTAVVTCLSCGEALELTFETDQIRIEPPGNSAAIPTELTIDVDHQTVSFRLPTGADLTAAAVCRDVEEARQVILRRCVLAAERGGSWIHPDSLSPAAIEAVAKRMAEVDPQADMRFACTCPRCSTDWLATLDIAEYLWVEVDAWAKRTLRDVHSLACGYGWREADVLALSPTRRQAYLALLSQ